MIKLESNTNYLLGLTVLLIASIVFNAATFTRVIWIEKEISKNCEMQKEYHKHDTDENIDYVFNMEITHGQTNNDLTQVEGRSEHIDNSNKQKSKQVYQTKPKQFTNDINKSNKKDVSDKKQVTVYKQYGSMNDESIGVLRIKRETGRKLRDGKRKQKDRKREAEKDKKYKKNRNRKNNKKNKGKKISDGRDNTDGINKDKVLHLVLDESKLGSQSTEKGSLISAWKMSDDDFNHFQNFCRFDKENGTVMILRDGLYMIYTQITYFDRTGRWSHQVYLGHRPFIKCITSEWGIEVDPETNMYFNSAHPCYSGAVTYISKNTELSVRKMYGDSHLLNDTQMSYFGIVKME